MHKYLSASELLVVGCCTLGGCGPGIIHSQWLVPRCLPNSVSPPCCPPFFSSSSSSSLPQRRCEPPVPQHLSTHLIVRPLLSNTHNGIFYLSKHMHGMPSFLGFAQHHCMHVCVCVCDSAVGNQKPRSLSLGLLCARPTDRPAGCYFAPFTASKLDCGEKDQNHLKKEEENEPKENVRVRCVALGIFISHCAASQLMEYLSDQ